MKQVIVLSAGHGNGDPGAVAQGTTEANETVQITERVAAYLRAWSFPAVVVQPHDVGDLVAEIRWVNARYKDINDALVVQIHKNSGGGNGSEVWYPSNGDANSRAQAKVIADELATATGEPNRGIKDAKTNRFGRLGWTDDTHPYALLVEAGFIDRNPVDDPADDRYALGIARGIMKIFGLTPAPSKVLATEAEVSQAYIEILERPVDAGGLKTYANSKFTIEEVRADLKASDEYKNLWARKTLFTFVSGTRLTNKKFRVIKDTKLVTIPAGAEANPAIYPVDREVEFAELLYYTNSLGEERKFYRTQYSVDKGVYNGFEFGSFQEVVPPVVNPDPGPTGPTGPITPPVSDKDKEQDARITALEQAWNAFLLGLVALVERLQGNKKG